MNTFLANLKSYRAVKQVSINTICSAISIIVNFVTIPLFINILSQKEYGIWLALFSMIAWISIVDVGIGSGLRNLLGIAIARDKNSDVKKYVYTAYVSISLICMIIFIINLIISMIIDLRVLFPYYEHPHISQIFNYTILSFLLIIQGKIAHSIAAAYHRSEVSSIVNTIQAVGVCIILLLINYLQLPKDILSFVKLFFILCLMIYTIPCIFIVKIIIGKAGFNRKNFRLETLNELFGFGWRFLILQLSSIILYSTDAFLLQYYFAPEIAAEYGIYLKYFGLTVLLTTIIGSPLWSVTVSASESQNRELFNVLSSKLPYYYLFVIICCFVLLLLQQPLFKIWVPNLISTDYSIMILIALYSVMQCILFMTGNIINGSGALFLQSVFAPLAAFINIVLVIGGVGILGMGASWIVASTIIANIPSLIINYIHCSKVLNGTNDGIWSR